MLHSYQGKAIVFPSFLLSERATTKLNAGLPSIYPLRQGGEVLSADVVSFLLGCSFRYEAVRGEERGPGGDRNVGGVEFRE